MTEEDWVPVSRYIGFVKMAKTSSAYSLCEHNFWTPACTTDDVLAEDEEESEVQPMDTEGEEDAFWHQDFPTDSREHCSHARVAWKRIFKKLGEIGKALSCPPCIE